MSELVHVPSSEEVARPDAIVAMELEVRERVRDISDLGVLASSSTNLNALAKALGGTKMAPYSMAAARRVEWQIGRVLGEPPGAGGDQKSDDRIESPASDLISADDVHKFRLIGTLNLDWDSIALWGRSRARLVKEALEARRVRSDDDPEILDGDFAEVLAYLDPGSVSMILTDPPYAMEYLPDYERLAVFAAEKLVDGGSLVCYTGHVILPQAIAVMSEHVRYWWLLALDHKSGTRQLPGVNVRVGWKPIMWFVKGTRRDANYVRDVVRGVTPEKQQHGWAQGVDEVLPLIEGLTSPDELVCDPFAGSGSFGRAAHKLGRRFIGADNRSALTSAGLLIPTDDRVTSG